MDAKLAGQIVKFTREWMDEMKYELIRACINGPVPGGINLLIMADVFGMKSDTLQEVQEYLAGPGQAALEKIQLETWHKCAEKVCHFVQEDGTCAHPDNMTPECHEGACPNHGRTGTGGADE